VTPTFNRKADRPMQGVSQKHGSKPFDLLRSFALLSLVSIVLIGVVSGVVLVRFLVNQMLERDALVTMGLVQSIAEAEEPRLFAIDSTLFENKEGLGEFLVHIARIPDVVRANLYTSNRVLVWSTEQRLIGKQFDINPELQRALAGELVFRLAKRRDKAEHEFFADDVTVFVESYVPIWDADRREIIGAAELYKVPPMLFSAITHTKRLVWGGGIFGGLFLYVMLFWIVRRGNDLIRRQERRLREEISENKRDKEMLRKSESKLRALSSQLLVAQEQERQRIASELHDGIGQSLSAIKFMIENSLNACRAVCGTETAEANLEMLGAIAKKTKDAIEETRRVAMELRPPMLDDLGIVATLDWFCREFQTIYPHITIAKRVELQENNIQGELKVAIYRIVQEGLNNVAKHTKADRVHLDLAAVRGQIALCIRDNGQGFDLLASGGSGGENGHRGLGLQSMRERTELSGGTFKIESSRGAGTVIHAWWPQPDTKLV